MLRTFISVLLYFVLFFIMTDRAFAQADKQNPEPAARVDRLRLQENDRVLFLGDSITEAGDRPGGYVSHVRDAIAAQLPDMKINVLGAGVSGNRVPDLQRRLQRDVLDRKPSVVVIYIGINDVWHSNSGNGTPIEAFESGLIDIIAQIKQAGARAVVVCTPSVIGEKNDDSNELDAMLNEFSTISRGVARQTGCHLLDLRREFVQKLNDNNSENRAEGVLTTDGVHLNSEGNRFVADQMLGALGVHMSGTDQPIRHVVLFNFNDDLPAKQIDEVLSAFAALPDKIDSVLDFESGGNISVENRSKGFTHCFMLSFADVAARDAYLRHAEHLLFVDFLNGKIEDVLVVDFQDKSGGQK